MTSKANIKVNTNYFNERMLQLFNSINRINKDNEENKCFLDVCSLMNVFDLIYKGVNDQYRKKLDDSELDKIIKLTPPSMSYRRGVFLRNGYHFKNNYKKEMEDTTILDFVPYTQKEVDRINKAVCRKFKNWMLPDVKFFDKPLGDYVFYIKDQSYFIGDWVHPFEEDDTRDGNFYISNDEIISIDTMRHPNGITIDEYQSKRLDSIIISLPYKDIDHFMLIIMPNRPHTQKELIEFCNDKLRVDDIVEFYDNKKKKRYDYFTIPKFKLESKWRLNSNTINNDVDDDDDDDSCNYLKVILNKSINCGNISDKLDRYVYNMINLESVSKIECNEIGTSIFTKSSGYATDSVPQKKLEIDKSFVFMIMNNNFMISKIGLFTGISD